MSVFLSKKMKYFMVLMDTQCVLNACEELCLTRTPLIKLIADVEYSLGGVLFVKKYNKLEPTPLAWSYYNKLRDVYLLLSELENDILMKNKKNTVTLKFDISIPALLYKYIISVLTSTLPEISFKYSRENITEVVTEKSTYSSNIFVSFRQLTCLSHYNNAGWGGIEVALISPKEMQNKAEKNIIYVAKENGVNHSRDFVSYFIRDLVDEYLIVEHEMDFVGVYHSLINGNGSTVVPLKTAMHYKNAHLTIKPINNKFGNVFIYHNPSNFHASSLSDVKSVLSSLL